MYNLLQFGKSSELHCAWYEYPLKRKPYIEIFNPSNAESTFVKGQVCKDFW